MTLFAATETALIEGRWSSARRLLESLATADDNTRELDDLSHYTLTLCQAPSAQVSKLIQDRIDQVNSAAERRRFGR